MLTHLVQNIAWLTEITLHDTKTCMESHEQPAGLEVRYTKHGKEAHYSAMQDTGLKNRWCLCYSEDLHSMIVILTKHILISIVSMKLVHNPFVFTV